jgi:FK506-binding protein 1
MSGLHHETIREGNGVDKPKKGDTVIIEYTGNLYDPEAQDGFHRGKQYVLHHPHTYLLVTPWF